MFASHKKPKNSYVRDAAKPNENRGSWGLPLWIGTIVFFGVLQLVSFIGNFFPFGDILSFLFGVPLAALVAEYGFIRLSGGDFPTLLQGALLITLGVLWPILGLSLGLALVMDDAPSLWLPFVVGVALILFYVGWGLSAMHVWEQKVL